MGRHRGTIVKRIPVKVRRRLTTTNRPFPVEDGLTATGPRSPSVNAATIPVAGTGQHGGINGTINSYRSTSWNRP